MAKRTGEDRIFVVPNVISMVRMAAIPAFLWALYGWDDPAWDERYYAAWILALLGISDFVDGYVARHFNLVTNFGKAFDPLADRIMLTVAVFTTVHVGAVPWQLAGAELFREALVASGAVLLASKGASRIDVKLIGKAGTLCMMIAFPLFLASTSAATWHEMARSAAWVFAVAGIVLGYASIAAYVPDLRRALEDASHRDEQKSGHPDASNTEADRVAADSAVTS